MDGHPLSWSVSQVEDFFRQHAARFLADQRSLRLPDLDVFVRALAENEIDGYLLLKSVDNAVLRDELGVPTFKARCAIVHCITKLREISETPVNAESLPSDLAPAPQTPNSINGVPHPNTASDHEPLLASTPGEHVRTGEVEYQDDRGKKRRKLDLTAIQTAPTATSRPARRSQAERPRPADDYMSRSQHTVDEVFYGPTKMNTEISYLQPDGHDILLQPDYEIVIEEDDPDPEGTRAWHAEAFLQFEHQEKHDGDAAYVYRQFRHFLGNSTSRMVSRHGRNDLVVLPYREELATGSKAVSAMVVRVDDRSTDGAVAFRENNALLEDDVDEIGADQEATEGEWDFLVKKWRPRDDEAYPVYGQSDNDGEMSEGLVREIEEEDNERKNERNEFIDKDEAGDIIDDELEKMMENWKESTLPRREEKQAWTVWRKMKGSKTFREQLIDIANDRIRGLGKRLAKQKENILRSEWRKDKEIRDQCEIMRVSVEDREVQRWQISVWNRRQEPHHVVRHSNGHYAGSKGGLEVANNQRVVVHANDRISVSPAPAPEDDMDLVHEPLHTSQDDNEIDGDDPDELMYEGDGHSFDGGDEMEEADSPMADWIEPSPPLVFGSPSQVTFDSAEDDYNDSTAPQNGVQDVTKDDTDLESESLPDMAVILSQRPRPASKPKSATPSNNREQPIEISSDSYSTPASKRKRKKGSAGKPAFTSYPELAHAGDIESWSMKDLIDQADRRRVLIKLLYDAGDKKRQEIEKYIRDLRLAPFIQQLKTAIGLLQRDFAVTANENGLETPVFCARLFLAWQFLAPETMYGERPANIAPKRYMDAAQLDMFSGLIKSTLEKHSLFEHPKPEPTSSVKSNRVISLLDSEDDDNDLLQDTPSKKRKRKVVTSERTQHTQMEAFTRQDRFKQKQQQSSSQQQLEAMIQNDPSRSHIQINILKGDDKDDIFVDKLIAKEMKDHQVAGVQFMWRELTAVTEAGADDAQGCILAHEQGLGKTMQAIAVLVALDEAAQSENPRIYEQLPPHLQLDERRQLRVLILVPAPLVANWRAELKKWAPDKFPYVWSIDPNKKDHRDVLDQWHRFGGIMLMGHESFQKKIAKHQGKQVVLIAEGRIEEVLLRPGPDVVVVDEAHRMANPKSLKTIAVNQIATESRLALTGTPMSNEVEEIYSLVSFVAPDYLGDRDWFSSKFALPIKEGNGKDSTAYKRRKAATRLRYLHERIEPKVDRADITVLKGVLPPKVEFVITLSLTDVQREAYSKYVRHLVGEGKTDDAAQVTLFGYLSVLTLLLNHPIAFKRKMLAPGKPPAPKKGKGRKSRAATPSDQSDSGEAKDDDNDIVDDAGDSIRTSGFTEEVITHIISHLEDTLDARLSTKMAMLVEIVRRSKEVGDKVLIFSQSIPSLDYLSELFEASKVDFVRIDGSVPAKVREQVLKEMQSGKRDVMLMSTRAGGVGLNIQVANRVIILDSSFNPTHEKQAISRSYRYGQKKPVFVYRFTVGGTFEDFLYNKQMFKERLNKGVVDKISTKRIANLDSKHAICEPTDVEQLPLDDSLGKDSILDGIVNDLRSNTVEPTRIMVRQLVTMEVLQEEVAEVEVELTEEERREAEADILLGRNAARGRKSGGAPSVSHAPSSTAPPRRQQSGSMMGPASFPNVVHGLPSATQAGPSQPPSRMVTLPTGAARSVTGGPRSTAPAIHGLPLPPPQ